MADTIKYSQKKRSKIYFASDMHFGTAGKTSSKEREIVFCSWLDHIKADAEQIYLVGDIFDYWYEYKTVIPRGHSHFMSKLRQIVDEGIEVVFFTGNHDVWMYDYFTEEYGIKVCSRPIEITLQNKKFLIGHGDGLGPGDIGYKLVKKIFTNRFCQFLWSRVHPNFALWLMKKTSSTSREAGTYEGEFLGADKEWLVQYAERKQKENSRDYYVFGHRHLPIDYTLSDGKGKYVNLGDWLYHYTYAVLAEGELSLKEYTI